jgi:hypothetical protein
MLIKEMAAALQKWKNLGNYFQGWGKGNQSDEVVRNRKKLFYFSLTFRLVLNNNDYTF